MDTRNLTEILCATIDPNKRQHAEQQLSQIHKRIGFAPCLLQVVMLNDVVIPVRQAGAVYLKNMVTSAWQENDFEEGEPIPFSIHEQDRALIRDAIVDAVVQAPYIIRVQLCVCLNTIIKHDFPKRWTQLVYKIHGYLQNRDANCWLGALLSVYQLFKNYEYRQAEERVPLFEAMNLLLPVMHNLMVNLYADQSVESVLIQKTILKCFYSLIKYTLPIELLTKDVFTQWMEVLRSVMQQPIPDHTQQVDEDERGKLPWWKCKKWALRSLYRLFERYGSPKNASLDYVLFTKWYLMTFTGGILEVLLRQLDLYRAKAYVSPRVLQLTINYINECVGPAHSWKLLKPHMFTIIQDVLFPLLSHSEADEQLWNSDPTEYRRIKFDIHKESVSPVSAAQILLTSCSKKKKDILERTFHLCMQVLARQDGEVDPRQRDGALHMVGLLARLLMKNKIYKEQIDFLVRQYVIPEFHSPLGYMRARAYWVLHCFATVRFKSEPLLVEAVSLTVNALLNDTELPVKIEAAIALQILLSEKRVNKILEPQVVTVTRELLRLIRQTEDEDVANVLQKIVPLYTEQLMPMAFEITDHLVTTFSKVIETDLLTDKAIVAMHLLHTLETVLKVMEDNPTIMAELEKTVLRVVGHILHYKITIYYDEAMMLIDNLTENSVSEDMWKVLELLYQVPEKDRLKYWRKMMPALYNYVKVDTNAFVSNENHVQAMFNMAKSVLNSDTEGDSVIEAAKLLEVTVLQCAGRIDNWLPAFAELVLHRLNKNVKNTEFRTMLLQVLIAILYCNPPLFCAILGNLQQSFPNASITQHFIKQWMHDIDYFLGVHDIKLCLLGICTLLELGPLRPNLEEVVPRLLPSCLVLFKRLNEAYDERAAESYEDSLSDEDEAALSSDEDDMGENESDDDDDYYTELEDDFTTTLDDKDSAVDEYVKFRQTISALSSSEPQLFQALMSALDEKQQTQLNVVFAMADLLKGLQDSSRIEQSGGDSSKGPALVTTEFKF